MFVPNSFIDGSAGGTPITAATLNNLENGLVAADITNPASAAALALATTYSRAGSARPGNRWVALGDSITAGVNGARYEDTAQLLSLGQMQLVKNAGVAGDRSDQMLARFDTDVTPSAPTVVTILAGTNDATQTVALATFITNMQALIAKVYSIGAVPVMCTIPPTADSPVGRQQLGLIYNTWIRRYAFSRGIALIDYYAVLVNPTTGVIQTAFNYDGTHPNAVGFALMGSLLQSKLAATLPPYKSLLPFDQIDANNNIKNALFIAQTGTPGALADQWDPYGSGGTYTTDGTDTTISGYWQKTAITSGTGVGLGARTIAGFTPVVGHTYAMCGLIKSDTVTGLTVNVQFAGPLTSVRPLDMYTQPIVKGAFYSEFVAPAGTTALWPSLTASGTGSFSVAQIGLYDLTAMGLA